MHPTKYNQYFVVSLVNPNEPFGKMWFSFDFSEEAVRLRDFYIKRNFLFCIISVFPIDF